MYNDLKLHSTTDEGYIKYQCHWKKISTIEEKDIIQLNQWRDRLYGLNLIGRYDNGIGFGNLSIRLDNSQHIIISGTQTGGIAELKAEHYTKVTDFNWQQNYVKCEGLIKASSETLTHAAIYTAQPEIKAVIHVHNAELWRQLLDEVEVPTTHPNCAYGTPEMAEELIRLCQQSKTQQAKIVVMRGHEEGIITFGKDLKEAGTVLLNYYESYLSR